MDQRDKGGEDLVNEAKGDQDVIGAETGKTTRSKHTINIKDARYLIFIC
jgi:hypothetical protein